MTANRFIVELEPGVWLAWWPGDPGRTLSRCDAKDYRSVVAAERALNEVRKYRPFAQARVVPIENRTAAKPQGE
jgi:hypothetical protein